MESCLSQEKVLFVNSIEARRESQRKIRFGFKISDEDMEKLGSRNLRDRKGFIWISFLAKKTTHNSVGHVDLGFPSLFNHFSMEIMRKKERRTCSSQNMENQEPRLTNVT